MTKPRRFPTYLRFVKIEHTLFSLPLIYAGTLLYSRGWFGRRLFLLILLAAAGARIMAMGLNRIIDAEIDALNPRTKQRELPSKMMTVMEAWAIVIVAGVVYLAAAAAIAPVCLQLSPIPVALFVAYPYLKRFTWLSHFGLGLAWSMAPLGGWLAGSKTLTGMAEIIPLWAFAILWVAGFDIIYATMDEAFDREAKLHSLPAQLGKAGALRASAMLHAMAFLALAVLWRMDLYSPVAFKWLLVTGGVFVWQHLIAARNPAFAFFQLNGLLGFLVLGMVLAGMR